MFHLNTKITAHRKATEETSEVNDKFSQLLSLRYAKIALLFAAAVLIAIRIPTIWSHGRFWAEEGTIFFVHARYLPWCKALFFSYYGYMNFAANLAAVLANNLVPLEQAPYISTIFAFIIQILPIALLCLSEQKWLQDRKILLAALLIVIILPFSTEVWLSSIGSQCHLNLCVGIILALAPGAGLIAFYQYVLLIFAPLSGPGAAFLLPLFILRAIIDRSQKRAVQATVLGLGTVLQLLFFYHHGVRSLGINPVLLLNVFYVKHLLEPLFGQLQSYPLGIHLHDSFAAGHISWRITIETFVAFSIFALTVWRSRKAEPIYFFLGGIIMASLSYCGALGDRIDLLNAGACDRYAYAPQVLLELSLLSLSCMSSGWTRIISRALIIWIIVIGLHEYFYIPEGSRNGPNWQSEIRQWRKDPNHVLAIWPKGWYMRLKPEKDY